MLVRLIAPVPKRGNPMKLTLFFLSFSCSSFCLAISDSNTQPYRFEHSKFRTNPTLLPTSVFKQLPRDQTKITTKRSIQKTTQKTSQKKISKTKATLAIGMLSDGLGEEMVWQNSRKISQLNWQIKATPILQAALTWQLRPGLELYTQAWHSLQKSNALMQDFDWMDVQRPEQVSHYSIHPATSLNVAHLLDLNVATALLPHQAPFQLKALLGIQQFQIKWQAKGGSYSYPHGQGQFTPNRAVVSYQQNWLTPYIGLSAHYDHRRWRIAGAIKYSAWAKGREEDLHHLRNIKFVSTAQNAQFYMFDLKLSYQATEYLNYFSVLDWTEYATAKSRQIQIDEATMGQNGLSNHHTTWKFGLEYRF